MVVSPRWPHATAAGRAISGVQAAGTADGPATFRSTLDAVVGLGAEGGCVTLAFRSCIGCRRASRLHARVGGLVPGGGGVRRLLMEEQMKTPQDLQTWRDMKMIDADGGKIGTIEDIFLDCHTGEPAWAAVKTGLFGTTRFGSVCRRRTSRTRRASMPKATDAGGGAQALGVLRPFGLRRLAGRRPHQGAGAPRRGRGPRTSVGDGHRGRRRRAGDRRRAVAARRGGDGPPGEREPGQNV